MNYIFDSTLLGHALFIASGCFCLAYIYIHIYVPVYSDMVKILTSASEDQDVIDL